MERWKDIPNFEGLYSVSDQGRVRSEARLDSIGRRISERIMRPNPHKDGYWQIDLRKDGKRYNVLVHKLVMLAFVGECPSGCEINHINENKKDNRLENLEYLTHTENIRHGTGIARCIESHKKPVIAIMPDGREIRFASAKDAGAYLGVDGAIIGRAIKDERRKTAYGMMWRFAEG